MQIIATMDQELQRTGHCYLRKENRFRELITLFTRLNAVIRAYLSGQVTEEDRRFLIDQSVSETAVKVGVFILPISAEQKKKLETEILKDLNAKNLLKFTLLSAMINRLYVKQIKEYMRL